MGAIYRPEKPRGFRVGGKGAAHVFKEAQQEASADGGIIVVSAEAVLAQTGTHSTPTAQQDATVKAPEYGAKQN